MTSMQVRKVFRKIAAGKFQHGSFLTHFANAMVHADRENSRLIEPAARKLIYKYGLELYGYSPWDKRKK